MIELEGIAGVDFGSKKAGTTAMAFSVGGFIHIEQSAKNEDADLFILNLAKELKLSTLFIDAPLSLPAVYSNNEVSSQDYFYRSADRELGAMSPMFIGGLTARAMRLVELLKPNGVKCYETYPSKKAEQLGLKKLAYKKDGLSACVEKIEPVFKPLKLKKEPQNWHAFDSLLALSSAYDFIKGKGYKTGDPKEGLIYW